MQDKFSQLAAELEGELVERTDEIRCALLALVAGCTFFMVGPPGCAKSLLARRIAARLSGVEFFDVGLNKFSTPEVLYGPHDLKALKAGRWERVVDGTLVTADFAHIDEIFEASTALLAAMLWALNERIFRQGSQVIPIPLSTVFMSSNTVPTEPRLAALWDRLLVRRVIEPVINVDAFTKMLLSPMADKPEAVLTWDEVRQAQGEAAAVVVPAGVVAVAFELRRELARQSIAPSDRRFVEAMGVVRASAWLDGRSEATTSDLACLADILWQFPDQVPLVRQKVRLTLESHIDPTTALRLDVESIRAQIRPDLPDRERRLLAEDLGGKIRRARTEMTTLSRAGCDTERVGGLLREVAAQVLEVLFDGDQAVLDRPPHHRART